MDRTQNSRMEEVHKARYGEAQTFHAVFWHIILPVPGMCSASWELAEPCRLEVFNGGFIR